MSLGDGFGGGGGGVGGFGLIGIGSVPDCALLQTGEAVITRNAIAGNTIRPTFLSIEFLSAHSGAERKLGTV